MTKGKRHLSAADRATFEAGLRMGKSLKQMGKLLGRSTSTLTRELRKHTYLSTKGLYGRGNQCVHRQTCQLHGVCKDMKGCLIKCALCEHRRCNQFCSKCEFIECPKRLQRTGGVCNGCPDEKGCHLRKFFYIADRAHEDYRRDLSEKRQGADIDKGELEYLDGIISPKVKDGQSMHHIYTSEPAAFTRNERTLSRYLHYGMFAAKRGDLKRSCMVRRRKPKSKDYEHKVETGCYLGRTFKDYGDFLSLNPGTAPVFMDLLIGRIGGKCLLTIHFVESALMLGILIPNKCAANVVAVFDRLYSELGPELFARLFPVILTDRGTEFSNPTRIETAPDGSRRTNVFFCDPMNSNQKSQIERNHELVREILPKSVSFDALGQEHIDLAMSHVNAYIRQSQSDRTPYDVFEFIRGPGIAAKLHIAKIDPRNVCLKPRLIGIQIN
jgi:IS30 family transposase